MLAGPGPMPEVTWFPGATLNYARNALRTARPRSHQDRGDSPRRGRPPGHADLLRARRRGRPGAGRAGRTRCDQGRPGRRVPAQCPGRAHRPTGDREPGRDLVLVLARLRAAQCDRPLRADHAEGAAGHRQLPIRRQGVRPAAVGRGHRRCPAGPVRRDHGGPRRRDHRCQAGGGHPGLRGPARRPDRSGGAGVRGRPVRPSAVGAVLVRDHGPAQGHRPQPRRDRARAPEGAVPAPGPRRRRRVLLVHHHRLDDVELPGRRAARGDDRGRLRRKRHLPGHRRAVAAGRRHRGQLFRHRRAVSDGLRQGRPVPGPGTEPGGAARHRLDRLPAAAGRVPVGLPAGGRPPAAGLVLRWHRRVHRLRGSLTPAAGTGRRHRRPLPGRPGGGVRRRRPAGHRRGR